MKPYYQDNWTTLYNGDCREALKTLPSESVNCVVTSPPYFGLRDYGTAAWEGGSDECGHRLRENRNTSSTLQGGKNNNDHELEGYKDYCRRCGAVRVDSQIGMEQSPDVYISALVNAFKEVWRVLGNSGVVFLNLGDSYAGSGKGGQSEGKRSENWQPEYANKGARYGLKPKDLIGIPWMAAFALRSQGFYLRSDIIWSKPNVMPESVTDRPTKAHEYIFLLSKSQTYYYNAEAIKEESVDPTIYRPAGRGFEGKYAGQNGHSFRMPSETRNRRSVWTVPTKPYPESHFAVFPPDLIRPCILAGCPVGGVVLDPFAGSGTTLQVAREAQCKSIGIELNSDYCKLIEKRLSQGVLDFATGD